MQKLPAFILSMAIPALMLCFCNSQQPVAEERPGIIIGADSLPYDLQNPVLIINLVSEELKEISGLSPTDVPGIYLAIADERGAVFFVDGNGGGAVKRRLLFRDKGDFEGVEMVEKTIWASKSDGDLFEIKDWGKETPNVTMFKTPLKKTDDVEGLAYDPERKSLLLACKGNPDSAYARKIYAFNLANKTLDSLPIYSIDPEEVNQWVPYTAKEKQDFFSPSGLAVHPITKDIYVISTSLKRLVILDYQTGKIKSAQRLDKKLLPQPEGISFDPQGNLLFSSEGKQGEGQLVKFNYIGKRGER